MTVFDDIYRGNLWNGVESRSGPGSGPVATRHLVPELAAIVAELGIESVVDVGCGDGYWMPDLPGYVGVDVSAEAIALASARHPDRLYARMDLVDIGRRFTPGVDLVICRDVMQHLPLEEGAALLDAMRHIGRWLLASTYRGGMNHDIRPGDAYSPDLEAEPFGMPPPERLIFDGHHYHEHGTDAVRDERKYLGLWRLYEAA